MDPSFFDLSVSEPYGWAECDSQVVIRAVTPDYFVAGVKAESKDTRMETDTTARIEYSFCERAFRFRHCSHAKGRNTRDGLDVRLLAILVCSTLEEKKEASVWRLQFQAGICV